MKITKYIILILIMLGITFAAAGCDEGPCMVTGTMELTVYRLPVAGSDVFGTLPAGESHEILARTVDGWVGFDPGIAQAGNQGLARLRWIQLNASLSPFCLASVDLVTLPEVVVDIPATSTALPPAPQPPAGAANMIITQVNLDTTILEENIFAMVEIIVQNQGNAPTTGYDVVLFPQYGNGPQNPGAQNAIPDLAPGDSHTITFSPGIIYSSHGTYTLRVLLTDDWYTSTGSTESTGTAGDFEDIEINVFPGRCNPFLDANIPVVLLNLQPDTRILPFYLKVEGGVTGDPTAYKASIGEWQSYMCGLQGFDDRLYCMVTIPEGMEGTSNQLRVWVEGCPEPALVQNNILIPIPIPKLVCSAGLNESDCKATGGEYKTVIGSDKSKCVCP